MKLLYLCILFVICVFLPSLFRTFEGMEDKPKNPNLVASDTYNSAVAVLDKAGYKTNLEDGLLMASNDPSLNEITKVSDPRK